jgi:hypothetical protein
MSALIHALDIHTPKQIGENGHVEYTWSNNIREKILQLSFQLTRTDERGVQKLASVLGDILGNLKTQQTINTVLTCEYLILLYKMIGQTRDIVDGKGECTYSDGRVYKGYFKDGKIHKKNEGMCLVC